MFSGAMDEPENIGLISQLPDIHGIFFLPGIFQQILQIII